MIESILKEIISSFDGNNKTIQKDFLLYNKSLSLKIEVYTFSNKKNSANCEIKVTLDDVANSLKVESPFSYPVKKLDKILNKISSNFSKKFMLWFFKNLKQIDDFPEEKIIPDNELTKVEESLDYDNKITINNETIILICLSNSNSYKEIKDKFITSGLNFFNNDYKNFAQSIFAYWKGESENLPEDLLHIINLKEDNITSDDSLYYLLKIDNITNIPNDLLEKSYIQRETGLKILAEEQPEIACSFLFSELPNSCIIL